MLRLLLAVAMSMELKQVRYLYLYEVMLDEERQNHACPTNDAIRPSLSLHLCLALSGRYLFFLSSAGLAIVLT